MSLSRTESLRKLPRLSPFRWIVVFFGFLLFVAVSFYLYVRFADSDHHHAEKVAIRIAQQQGGLKKIDKATMQSWEEKVWVVYGKDENKAEWMIWERESELLKFKVDENVSEKRMLAMFKDEHGGKEPIRLLAGWFQDQPVWEIRYWSDNGKKHQAIDFYSFKDGTRLTTYDLPSPY